MRITGELRSMHPGADCIAASLSPDNGGFMRVDVEDGCVVARIEGESLRSVLATVDDYLMNLSISERLC